MKIEKINENQIRCTLTREDLESHQIRISELAYGTEKAKKLFRDMMQQAQLQFGFEADNIPLMIEAIPVNAESIVLIITKVEDPEELDTRFSKFAPSRGGDQGDTLQLDGADNIIDMFQKIYEAKRNLSSEDSSKKKEDTGNNQTPEDTKEEPEINLIRMFLFQHLDDVISAARGLNGFFSGTDSLYKDPVNGTYQLILHQDSSSPEDFNKVCNILSEYGQGKAFTFAGEAHLKEHGELITKQALQSLAQL